MGLQKLTTTSTKTLSQKDALASRGWRIVDAAGVPVGRLASEVAAIIRGKTKRTFSPHLDCGDFVVIINSDKAVFTGTKPETKLYHWHTGYFGGIKQKSAGEMLAHHSDRVLRLAIWGMLPKGPLGRRLITKAKIYRGAQHEHAAQKPVEYKVRGLVKARVSK